MSKSPAAIPCQVLLLEVVLRPTPMILSSVMDDPDPPVDNLRHGSLLVQRVWVCLLGLLGILALLGDHLATHNTGVHGVANLAVAVSSAAKPQIEGH